MSRISFLLAWRYIRAGSREQSVGSMIGICILGSTLGALALTLVACIMQGFEQATHRALQSINPSMVMRSNGQELQYEKINTILQKEFPEIKASAPTNALYVLIKEPEDTTHVGTVLLIKGIDPAKELRITALQQTLAIPANQSLEHVLHDNHIIIGKKLAEQQALACGDTIHVLSIQYRDGAPHLNEADAVISGFLNTGIEDVDQTMALTHLDFIKNLAPALGITEIGLATNNSKKIGSLIQRLHHRFGLEVLSWHEQYPALVWALKLEKYAAFLVMALISLVASMSIISLLFMFITHKRRDIALLIACGLSTRAIRCIFLSIGVVIGSIGACCGTGLAFIIGTILTRGICIPLPDIYYTPTLPIDLDPFIFSIVFVVIILMSTIASIIPLRQVNRINCADVLRFEG